MSTFSDKVKNIRRFRTIVNFPPFVSFYDRAKVHEVADAIFEDVTKHIRNVKFFHEDQLSVQREESAILVVYGDDVFDFRIYCGESSIVVERTGSKLSTFDEWYKKFMDKGGQFIDTLLKTIARVYEKKIPPLTSAFAFDILAHDLRMDNKPIRNFDVMEKLTPLVPDDGGKLIQPRSQSDLTRLDYNIHMWSKGESKRNLKYQVEAPANKGFSTLWFKFSYSSLTYTDPRSRERSESKPLDVFREHNEILSWFKDAAIGNFMRELLEGFEFETTASDIP